MDYIVQIVGDDELPAGRDVVIVETADGPPFMLISGPHARAWEMIQAYGDGCEPEVAPTSLHMSPFGLMLAG